MASPARPTSHRSHPNARDPVLGVIVALIIVALGLVPGREASAECGKGSECWTWTAVETKGAAPNPRWGHSAVWTGKEMLVFGGVEDLKIGPTIPPAPGPGTVRAVYNDLWSYTPSTKTWKQLHPSGHLPARRSNHAAVWTGHEMLVYGGWRTDSHDAAISVYNDVWAYTPGNNHWEQMTVLLGTAPFRNWHTAVWARNANNPGFMLVFGGYDPTVYPLQDTNDTLGFDLGRRQWTSSVNIGLPLPPARWGAAAVWSDRARELGGMWLFGGCHDVGKRSLTCLNDAWRWASASEFDEVRMGHPPDSPPLPLPLPRAFHTAVLIDGGQFLWMVIFGGTGWSEAFNDLHAMELKTKDGKPVGSWIDLLTSDEGRPPARFEHTAVWTNKEMLVFGGHCTTCSKPINNTLWSLQPPAGLLH